MLSTYEVNENDSTCSVTGSLLTRTKMHATKRKVVLVNYENK